MTTAKRAEVNKWSDLRNRSAGYLRNVVAELKKVHWPNRKELITYTGVVLVSVAFVAMLIWLVDSALSVLINELFKAFGK